MFHINRPFNHKPSNTVYTLYHNQSAFNPSPMKQNFCNPVRKQPVHSIPNPFPILYSFKISAPSTSVYKPANLVSLLRFRRTCFIGIHIGILPAQTYVFLFSVRCSLILLCLQHKSEVDQNIAAVTETTS